ncbi:MAG: SDR family NAD(P)-dependent oxidoreductase [Saprospiraceae bacterium]|nr:SDR family NAD(P)-dependent oxidoreductase [Saprospiraceae bacterium]
MKTILITGATSGIGKQTALSLAKLGHRIIITGRNKASGESAVQEIMQQSGNSNIELLLADISIKAGVQSLVNQFNQKYETLDVLINNAGSAANEHKLTADGLETNFAVNVLTPFLLTKLLWDSLKKSKSARVITLMGGDLPKTIDLNNLQAENKFDGLNYYSQSKMQMMALMYELSQRNTDKNITINICYPGQAATSMTQNVTPEMLPFLMRPLFPIFKYLVKNDGGKSAEKASRSSVYMATSPEVEGKTGLYFNKNVQEKPFPNAVTDEINRKTIWDYVQKII